MASACVDYIHSHLDRSLHLAELAAVADMSQYHFCRLFKQSLGIAPYQYVLQKRMEKAKELLHQGTYTIAEISLLTSCIDQSRFSKQFKRHFGITPSEMSGKKLSLKPLTLGENRNVMTQPHDYATH